MGLLFLDLTHPLVRVYSMLPIYVVMGPNILPQAGKEISKVKSLAS